MDPSPRRSGTSSPPPEAAQARANGDCFWAFTASGGRSASDDRVALRLDLPNLRLCRHLMDPTTNAGGPSTQSVREGGSGRAVRCVGTAAAVLVGVSRRLAERSCDRGFAGTGSNRQSRFDRCVPDAAVQIPRGSCSAARFAAAR